MGSDRWPVLGDFSMLLVNNNRSKCYLQNLVKAGHVPSEVIALEAGNVVLPEHTQNDLKIHAATDQKFIRECPEAGISFDEKESIFKTLKRENIPHRILPTLDANAPAVAKAMASAPGEYAVYSGPGGTVLRKELLSAGKKILHVHPGWLPSYRGSTTIYYAMLAGDEIGCSVIAFTEEIDSGPVFHRASFKVRSVRDMDHVFDPAVRTAALLQFFKANRGRPPKPLEAGKDEENVFYIIHPVLKHLSILKHGGKV